MAGTSSRLRRRANTKASSARARRRRNVFSYKDISDSDAAPRQVGHVAPEQTPRSSIRQRRARISYHEDSADSDTNMLDDALGQDEFVARTASQQAGRRRATSSQSKPSTRSRKRKVPPPRRQNFTVGLKRQKNATHPSLHATQDIRQNEAVWSKKPMPWSTLPYHFWLSVFSYASYPLVSTTFDPLPSISWLLRTASVCKAFLEPALTALYYEPPIYSPKQMPRLSALLLQQDEGSIINYRVKVKHLSIDSMISSSIRDMFMETTIPCLSQLQGIALGVHSDDPKLCRLHGRPPPAHAINSMSIYSVLESTETLLKHWTWNRTIDSHFLSLSAIRDVHRSSPFQSLASLTFVDFHLPEMVEYIGHQTRGEEALADTLGALPSLRKLEFRLADVINERLMPLLPDNLQTLVLTSCYNLFSPDLTAFLNAKGQLLKELVLSHNQSLSLSFLTTLSNTCPRLEILMMDLLYYNSHTTFNDSSPRYESLLRAEQQPSWPSTMRHIELFQLRRWKTPAAELFFSSFVNSARSLPDLRHLEIKASVDESSWRDRIAFRDKWVRRLNEVFLRKSAPPNPHLQSFAAYRKWKLRDESTRGATEDSPRRKSNPMLGVPSKRAAKPTPTSDDSDDSDAPLIKVRRSAREKAQQPGMYNQSDDSIGEGSKVSSNEEPSPENDDTNLPTRGKQRATEEPGYVQGLCNVVDIVIDNLRPAEEQLRETDFLDDERSGDEDWNGDDDMDDGRYAW